MRNFLTRMEKNPPRGLDGIQASLSEEIWKETDCLSCANCCKTMSPTFTNADISRISEYLKMTPAEFKEKWLYLDKIGDWMNVKQPCQFLDLKSNMCSIYAVRPADCAGFPHLTKKKAKDYLHVHGQNVEYCPATFSMVEKMMLQMGKAPLK
ncbi:MAG: YkgJ family cysteine cluster protein [Chitinophagaceae bacterium]